MDNVDIKINELKSKLFPGKPIKVPVGIRLFIIGKGIYIRIYKENIEVGYYVPEFRLGKRLELDRGKILDFFSKLEFLVNELFILKITPNDYKRGYILDKLLERVDLFSRIAILKELNVINQSTFESILKLKDVRNGFAHLWGASEIKYKNKPIKPHFEEFKKEAETVWDTLESIYIEEQKMIDIDGILKQIDDLNKTT